MTTNPGDDERGSRAPSEEWSEVVTAGAQAVAALKAAREVLADIRSGLVKVDHRELADLAAAVSGMVAEAESLRAAVVLEASSRGVIAQSDHPRAHRWVEQSCRDAGVPVVRRQARELGDIAITCAGHDVAALREAVTAGKIPMESAATVAKAYRKLRQEIEYPNWDALLNIIIDWAAEGASPKELRTLEDGLIGRYGREKDLDEKHERTHALRELTGFHRHRLGRMVAMLRLDPASEATFTAALHAVSAPHLDENGQVDPRTPGQRRADALVTMATMATTPVKDVRGFGAKARVTVTIGLDELTSGLTDAGYEQDFRGEPLGLTAPHFAQSHSDAGSVGTAEGMGRGERGCGITGFDQALSPTEIRILACDAQIIPAVLGTHGEILDLGHAKRLVTPGLTAALHLRDKGCTFPGCTTPPSWCDGHHIVYWAKGGKTDLDNLALLCRHHHTEVHRRGHIATVDRITGVHWARADGSPIGNSPR